MSLYIPTLEADGAGIRPIRVRDARVLEYELAHNRAWLSRWEATNPNGVRGFDARASIRSLLETARAGHGLPFAIESGGVFAGQLNVSSISYGSLSSASIGYWVSERFAGHGLTPTAVALATDYCFSGLNLHRIEICIRPENNKSLRVVEKLGFRYEGLRRRFIHINGEWCDHFSFALVAEEVREGVLQRWRNGRAPAVIIPDTDRLTASRPLPLSVR